MVRIFNKLTLFSWLILLILILCLAYFWRVSLIARQARIELSSYGNAQFCQANNNCRQIFQAKVLESKTTRSVQRLPSKYTSLGSSRVHNIACQVRLRLSNLEEIDITVLTNLDLAEYQFDVPNVSIPIPSWNYDDISAHSFPVGAILHVEMWLGKPTFIYSKYVNATNYTVDTDVIFPPDTSLTDLANSDIFFEEMIPSPETNISPANLHPLDTTGEYAVPTTDHPLLEYNLKNADVQGVFHFSIFLIGMFLIIQYLNGRS